MTPFSLRHAALALVLLAACGSDDDDSASTAGATTLSCSVQLSGFAPECQFYEATGADAVKVIAQLRAGCVDQSAGKLSVVDACASADNLGGCKHAVEVKNDPNVQVNLTTYFYKAASGETELYSSTAAVESSCPSDGSTFAPAP